MPENGLDSATLRADFEHIIAARAEQPLRVMRRPSAVLLLTGDAGSGKTYLAEYVARRLEASPEGPIQVFVLPRPTDADDRPRTIFGDLFPEAFPETGDRAPESAGVSSSDLADRILEDAHAQAGEAEPLFVLPGVDHYGPRETVVLERLIRRREARIICTARRLTGGANHTAHDPRVARLTVPPLSLEESDALTASLLGNARLASSTLRRWFDLTRGNSYALMLMVIANERRGNLKRLQGVAYVPEGSDVIPEELVDHIRGRCTPAEFALLERLALAEPISEPSLLRRLDPQAMSALLDRDVITTHPGDGARPVLKISRPVLAAALRASLSPAARIRLADELFQALADELREDDDATQHSLLLRAVALGLESGARLPHAWLTGAIDLLLDEVDPPLLLRVSLALASSHHTADAAAAAVRALSLAVQLGSGVAAAEAYRRITAFVEDEDMYASLPSMLRNRLSLALVERRFALGAPLSEVLGLLDRFEAGLGDDEEVSREAVHALRFRMLLRAGEFARAAAHQVETEPSSEIVIEWVRAPALSASSVLLQQRGEMEEAIRIAHRARSISLIGRRPLNDLLEVQGFYWFLGYWASGCSSSARQALEEISAEAEATGQAGAGHSELVDTGWALLALQEARWRDAADIVELLLVNRVPTDPYGLAPLLSAVRALALAALGDRPHAVMELRRARTQRRGISEVAAGFRMRLAAQAQQWLRVGDVGAEALALAGWAQEHDLGLIELQAMHLAAVESRQLASQVLERARDVAGGVDPLIAEVIFTHIEKIAEGSSPTDVSEPEVRLLADLGLWLPLPGSTDLSPREREIALLASLGFSSRSIAERFHLSVRTVETHLAHVYAKLGLADRAELRLWFSADRRISDEARSFGRLGGRAA